MTLKIPTYSSTNHLPKKNCTYLRLIPVKKGNNRMKRKLQTVQTESKGKRIQIRYVFTDDSHGSLGTMYMVG